MKPKYFYPFIIVVQTTLAIARTYPNYGYYNPFPPKNQVLYNFSPISDTNENNIINEKTKTLKNKYNISHGRKKDNENNSYNIIRNTNDKSQNPKYGKYREIRDLSWREFDVFLRGDAEPSCAELRQMWNLARKLQKTGSNQKPGNEHLSFHHHKSGKNSHYKKHGKSTSERDINSVATTDKKLSPTDYNVDILSVNNNSGVNAPLSNDKVVINPISSQKTSSNYNSTSSMRHNPINNKTVDSGSSTSSSSSSLDEDVYGIIKTHHHVPVLPTTPNPAKSNTSPTSRYNTFRVRDPAKEIFGMFKQRSKSLRNRQRKQHNNRKYHYGKVQLETPKNKPSSYLDLLQRKLYGTTNQEQISSNNDVYGVVNQYASSSSDRSQSSYDKVRELLEGQGRSQGYEGDLQLHPGESAFDRIRDRLMKTRARDKLSAPKSYLRRLRSKKRRQNVSMVCNYSSS